MSKSALGRGLGALLGGNASKPESKSPGVAAATPMVQAVAPAVERDRVNLVPLNQIHPSLLQPRKDFAPEALKELADSIREHGVLQPLIVRRSKDGYELIAGERRWRAAQSLQLTAVPVVVREADDHTTLELMLIENLQREDLNPIEEALGYQQLINQFNLRQEEVAVKVGRNRASVANALRLLSLPEEIQAWVCHGQISTGHAKVILGLDTAEDRYAAAQNVIRSGLSVRETEAMVANWQGRNKLAPTRDGAANSAPRDVHVAHLENEIQQRFGTKVQLRYRKGKGAVTIHFYSEDELERLLNIFSVKVG
jgi:ParB family chromosome partitioning protein